MINALIRSIISPSSGKLPVSFFEYNKVVFALISYTPFAPGTSSGVMPVSFLIRSARPAALG